jgi:uncharacterized membrane protein YedE/YeeE
MNDIFPIAPQDGFSTPVFLGLSLLLGVGFGFFLERAGFGTAKNLTSIFILRDFRVMRVMFSALLTAMLGSLLLDRLGWLDLSLVDYDPTYFWSMLVGGLIFGVGFYVGGFCPGTAVVAFVRGRWDAPAFLVGIMAGIYGFALLFEGVGQESWFLDFFAPKDATHQTLYGDGPAWPWALGITAIAVVAFMVLPPVERRFRLRSLEELEGRDPPAPEPEFRRRPNPALWNRLAPALAFCAALALALLEWEDTEPRVSGISQTDAVTALDQAQSLSVDVWTLASWVLADSHASAKGEPASSLVLDLRPAGSVPAVPGAQHLAGTSNSGLDAVAMAASWINDTLPQGGRNTRFVLFGGGDPQEEGLQLGLRRLGWQVYRLDGGVAAWERDLLGTTTEWPLPPMDAGDARDARQAITAWLGGSRSELPPRLVFTGAVPPPIKVATAKAKGAGGGGCN